MVENKTSLVPLNNSRFDYKKHRFDLIRRDHNRPRIVESIEIQSHPTVSKPDCASFQSLVEISRLSFVRYTER